MSSWSYQHVFLRLMVATAIVLSPALLSGAPKQSNSSKQSKRSSGLPEKIKLEEQGIEYAIPSRWIAIEPRGLEGLVHGAMLRDPSLVRNTPQAAAAAAAAAGPPTHMMLRVLPLEQGKTVDDVVAKVTREFNCCGPHFKATPGGDVKLAGEPARSVTFEPNEPRAKNQKMVVTAAQHGDRAYVFTLTTAAERFADVKKDMDYMLSTTRWLGPKLPPTPLPAKTAGVQTYTFTEHGFRHDAPAAWKQAKAPAFVQALSAPSTPADKGQPVAMLLKVHDLAPGQKLDDVATEQVHYMKAHSYTADVKEDPASKDLKIDGESARAWVASGTTPADKDQRRYVVVTTHLGKQYIFWFTGMADTYDAMRVEADNILKSFKWLEKAPATAQPASAKPANPNDGFDN